MKKDELKKRYEAFMAKNPRLRKIIGVGCIIVGVFSLLTPLTPGSWLIFVGLEILGVRFLFSDKLKDYFKRKKPSQESVKDTEQY